VYTRTHKCLSYIRAMACAYTLGHVLLDSNRITIEIVKRAFVPNLRNRIKVTTAHERKIPTVMSIEDNVTLSEYIHTSS